MPVWVGAGAVQLHAALRPILLQFKLPVGCRPALRAAQMQAMLLLSLLRLWLAWSVVSYLIVYMLQRQYIPYLCACILLCNTVPCFAVPRHGPRVCTRWIW
jgi:hypothetical protein